MFNFGVCYYPEQWPEERWAIDARLMAEAGFNVVRLGEFAWSRMEPEEGRFDFSWLDRAIDLLAAQGLRVMLGTPTAAPPPWLMQARPELFRVREDGLRVTFGNRREYCPNHPGYHEASRRIVTAMAKHYAGHPAVYAWQIDNEFGDRCYCQVCTQEFQDWLSERHGSLETLNERWGTAFWSHVYTEWDQIPVPLTTGGQPNPGLALDFVRFSSDSYVAYQRLQIKILREHCPGHLITHNFMGFHYDRLNYFDLAQELDVVAWDNYPRGFWNIVSEVEPANSALDATTMRGLKGKNVWVTEQQAGIGGWDIMGVAPRPGEIRLWAYQTIAHGADAVLFFRWRTARHGTEQYWHGLLNHDAQPSRRYHEVKRMGEELRRAGATIEGASFKSPVGLMLSYDSRFAFQLQRNNPAMSYSRHMRQIFQALHHHQLGTDIVPPSGDLAGYKLLIVPGLYLLDEALAERLRQYVAGGGTLVLTARTGVKDEHNVIVEQPLPGLLRELCGVQVEEYDSLPEGAANPLSFTVPALAGRDDLTAQIWCDVLALRGAEPVATYTREFYAGQPAITLHRSGQGQVVYVGTQGNAELYHALVGWMVELAGVPRLLAAAPGVEVTERWQGGQRLLFVLNHTQKEQRISLDASYVNLLGGPEPLVGAVALPAREVMVLVPGS